MPSLQCSLHLHLPKAPLQSLWEGLSVCLSVSLPACLCTCRFVSLSVCLPVCPSVCLLSIYPCVSLCLCVCLPIHLSATSSFYPSRDFVPHRRWCVAIVPSGRPSCHTWTGQRECVNAATSHVNKVSEVVS